MSAAPRKVSLLDISIDDLQKLLDNGVVTSVELVHVSERPVYLLSTC